VPVKKRASNARRSDQLVTVENVNVPGHRTRVDAAKYEAMRRALLRVVPRTKPGITQSEMFRAVLPYLPHALVPGGATASWWAKTAQLDLEAKGVLRREATRPLRWYRPSA
jgi:hypothetical protein